MAWRRSAVAQALGHRHMGPNRRSRQSGLSMSAGVLPGKQCESQTRRLGALPRFSQIGLRSSVLLIAGLFDKSLPNYMDRDPWIRITKSTGLHYRTTRWLPHCTPGPYTTDCDTIRPIPKTTNCIASSTSVVSTSVLFSEASSPLWRFSTPT